jgi:hypothetical protein
MESAARTCKHPSSGFYKVTAYVVQKGKTGRVAAVGVVPPHSDSGWGAKASAKGAPHGDEAIECLAKIVEDARMPNPGRVPAKVMFRL